MNIKKITLGIMLATSPLMFSSELIAKETSDLRMVFSQEIWEENQDNKLAQFYIAEQKFKADDYSSALKWYIKSANSGFKSAVDNAKIMIDNGLGVKNNMDEVVDFLSREGLENNDLFSQMYLGDVYRDGRYKKDYERSFFWYSKAAMQGEPRAEYYIANMSVAGIGTPQNVPRGVRLLEKVAETNHMGAVYNLGKIFKRGFNVNQNHKEAVKWFSLNAERGHVESMYELADSYEKGFGVERSYADALEWYELAGVHNHVKAMHRAGMIHILNREVSDEFRFTRGLEWLDKAANRGNVESQLRLGDMYYSGKEGVVKDYQIAEKYYKMAADAGEQIAYKKLTFLYREGGYGIQRDDELYEKYLEKYYTYEPDLLKEPKDRLNLFNYNIFDF